MKKLHPIVFSILTTLLMGVFYYLLLFLTTADPLHPFTFFREKWILLGLLFSTFFGNMYFYQKLRQHICKHESKVAGSTATVNGVSMVACCAHHLADIFPILSLFGIAAFMTDFQDYFIIFGIISNIFAIFYMNFHLKKIHE